MRVKKFVLAITAVAIFAAGLTCFAVVSHAAEYNQIAVTQRTEAEAGVWFVLSEFVQGVENPDEGHYEFAFTAEDINPAAGGCAYKIVTARGSNTGQRWLTLTPRDTRTGIATLVTHMPNTDDLIPADVIVRAADLGQNLLFCTQDDHNPFTILEIIVAHILDDGTRVEVYRMSEDPAIQGLTSGERFASGSMGLAAATSGTGGSMAVLSVTAEGGEAAEPPVFDNNVDTPDAPDTTPATPDTTPAPATTDNNTTTDTPDTSDNPDTATSDNSAQAPPPEPRSTVNEGENLLVVILGGAVGASVLAAIVGSLVLRKS
ncbi:MAG: hypothetical protein FWH20_06720 [Oscillospiraceae bacterium]|nr:hypothetical protein [Oscillospiraceae bacterium]